MLAAALKCVSKSWQTLPSALGVCPKEKVLLFLLSSGRFEEKLGEKGAV